MEKDYVTKTELATELAATKVELLERIEKVETTLLKEFRKWAMNFESRTPDQRAYDYRAS